MKKFLLFILFLSAVFTFAESPPSDRARGVFLALGVGPRIPVFALSDRAQMGYGFEAELSYTDSKYIPFFLYGKIGYEQYPGAQEFYHYSDYSHYSKNLVPLSLGVRYFFAPIFKNFVLITPIVEIGTSLAIYQELQEFKLGSGKPEKLENGVLQGVNFGVGVSMFFLEMVASYNIYKETQSLGLTVKIRLPLYISL